jgi:thiopeptide-type bacteriocin biosynthesis protein
MLTARGPGDTVPLCDAVGCLPGTRLPRDPAVRAALAVASPTLFERLSRVPAAEDDAASVESKLLRYLVRMSSRATPFGMLAGVGLARWGERTDLSLDPARFRTRTRPDMEWLLGRLLALEARIEVRRRLRMQTNPAAFACGSRIVLSKQEADGALVPRNGVSIRATPVVRRTLALARAPIAYVELVAALAREFHSVERAKVEALLTQLWESTLLLTELRPAPTALHPAREIARRLEEIPEASDVAAEIRSVLDGSEAWDALAFDERAAAYLRLSKAEDPSGVRARSTSAGPDAPQTRVQVDMGLAFTDTGVSRLVGLEAARAAELLLRLSPSAQGPETLASLRAAFTEKYGFEREVPLLELLDPDCGLGLEAKPAREPDPPTERERVLLALASRALAERRRVIELDPALLRRLLPSDFTPETFPLSLDLHAQVAARSREALDRGDFRLVVAPLVGAPEAGQMLGRFADMLPGGDEALAGLAKGVRDVAAPDCIWAELVHLPEPIHFANVVLRPAVCAYEIALGASPSVPPDRVIPPGELVVGLRHGRFYVRWPKRGVYVAIRVGHILNMTHAGPLARFLWAVGSGGRAKLSPFAWGVAASFPFLPRVESGRVVLSLAQWTLDDFAREELRPADRKGFPAALAGWRSRWEVPRHVYLRERDNRLLLDLEHPLHAEELRRELAAGDRNVTLQEALPGPDDAWLEGAGGRYLSEIVVSLIQDEAPSFPPEPREHARRAPPPHRVVLMPPGSEWLFAKLYTNPLFEEDLVAGPVRIFSEDLVARKVVDEWFYIRYADPDPHVRLRFRGSKERVLGEVLPAVCAWAGELVGQRACSRFALDSYDREVERYGGPEGMAVSEAIFFADSRAVSAMLHLLARRLVEVDREDLAVLTACDLLDALGLDPQRRRTWLAERVTSRAEVGPEFRRRRGRLLPLLGAPDGLKASRGGEQILALLAHRRAAIAPLAGELGRLREQALSRPVDELFASYLHMHFNRWFGVKRETERRLQGLLLRASDSLRHQQTPASGTSLPADAGARSGTD